LGFADTSHLQIGMVSSILAYKFGSTFAWITSASVATYIAFTLAVTQVQTQYYAVKVQTYILSGYSCGFSYLIWCHHVMSKYVLLYF
jgi:hypothetical protein